MFYTKEVARRKNLYTNGKGGGPALPSSLSAVQVQLKVVQLLALEKVRMESKAVVSDFLKVAQRNRQIVLLKSYSPQCRNRLLLFLTQQLIWSQVNQKKKQHSHLLKTIDREQNAVLKHIATQNNILGELVFQWWKTLKNYNKHANKKSTWSDFLLSCGVSCV